jgi:hypothetical protein
MAEQRDTTRTEPPKKPAAIGDGQKEETAQTLLNDWRRLLTAAVGETEKFTKEKPLVALTASFAAGVVFDELLSALFRRRRR